jgi:hypothetical protein
MCGNDGCAFGERSSRVHAFGEYLADELKEGIGCVLLAGGRLGGGVGIGHEFGWFVGCELFLWSSIDGVSGVPSGSRRGRNQAYINNKARTYARADLSG